MTIPLLAIPVLNRPDLLRECVASIDYPVKRLLIIDNSYSGGMGEIALEAAPGCVDDVVWTEPPANLGFTASVNFAIRTHAHLPWWCIANADTRFAPGDLDRLALATEAGGWVGVVDWRVFGLTAETVEKVGLWDENFYNYCSDADYEWRCQQAGAMYGSLGGETSHVGSVCYQGDTRNAANNARTYPLERDYYRAKWGGELRGGERYTTPFDRGGSVADWTPPSLGRIRELAWR